MPFDIDPFSALFRGAFGSILPANGMLSGDNARVIAIAARSLQPGRRVRAIFWGSAAAIVMRIVHALVAIRLLSLPVLKTIGGGLLAYTGIHLLGGGDGESPPIQGMGAAIRTILVADLVMSLDDLPAVADAAQGNMPLRVLGLLVSRPLIVFAATRPDATRRRPEGRAVHAGRRRLQKLSRGGLRRWSARHLRLTSAPVFSGTGCRWPT